MAPVEAKSLYRQLLRQAVRFGGYNFRYYAVRKVRDSFVQNRSLSDPQAVAAALEEGQKMVGLLNRQATISNMFTVPDLVVERRSPTA